MWAYTIHRALHTIPVLIGVTLLTFILFHAIPGDPARLALGMRPNVATMEMLRKQWGYDKPLHEQYLHFLGRTVTGDLGQSTNTGRDVLETILYHAPKTALLGVAAMIFAVVIGIPAGIISAIRRNSIIDFTAML